MLPVMPKMNPLFSDGDFTKGDISPKLVGFIVLIKSMFCCIVLLVSIVIFYNINVPRKKCVVSG